jgi:ATP-dependent DNA ligase
MLIFHSRWHSFARSPSTHPAANCFAERRAAERRGLAAFGVKHDGHRLLATVSGDGLKLISRNGHDRTALFRAPFDKLAADGLAPLVLDGEIAMPDERGVTHIDLSTQAMRQCCPERLRPPPPRRP